MRRIEETAFLVIVILNTIVTFLYMVWGLLIYPVMRREEGGGEEYSRAGYAIKAVVMFLCPVVGPLFFVAGHSLYFLLFHQDVDLEDVIFSKERVKTHLKADEERERNMVPLEEAIAISDKDSLRTLMLNVVKGDIQKSLSAITLALDSEDSETAHYAASVLRDELNDFRAKVQKTYEQVRQGGKDQGEYAVVLIDYMDNVLKQKVFSPMEQESFVNILAEVCDILYQNDRERMRSSFYENICMRLLEIRDFQQTEEWCRRGAREYPDELFAYTCQLKLYFTTQQKEKFFQVLTSLKSSDVIIDSETLELIRTFS